MKCEIIRDLLPLYADGLCSDATKSEIEEHIKDCPQCTQSLENYRKKINSDAETNKKNMLESAGFIKAGRKIKRIRIKSIISLVLVIILAVVNGVLIYGQYERTSGIPSYDTVIASHVASGQTEYLLNGNIDAFSQNMMLTTDFDTFTSSDYTAREKTAVKNLNFLYSTYLKGKNIKVKSKQSGYGSLGSTGMFYSEPAISVTLSVTEHVDLNIMYFYGDFKGNSVIIVIKADENGSGTITANEKGLVKFVNKVLAPSLYIK